MPICGRGVGSVFVGRAVYLASMASVGLKEVFIFLRLRSVVGGSVEWVPLDDVQSLWVGRGWRDKLRRTAGVGVDSAKTVERYTDFFLAYLVALVKDVSEVPLVYGHGNWVPCPGTFGVLSAMRAIDA